eukprot:gene58023-77425_t
MSLADASLRWMMHHSQLRGEYGDGVIVGGSTMNHLTTNLKSCDEGPLSSNLMRKNYAVTGLD